MHFRIHSIADTNAVPALINITHQIMSEVSALFFFNLFNYLQFHMQRAVLYLTETKKKKGLKRSYWKID